MSPALVVALLFTVVLLATTTYFLLGAVPLLVLKHDTPMDSRFVRGFFDIHHRVAAVSAGAAALSYAMAGKPAIAAGAAALALLATGLRHRLLAQMDTLHAAIQVDAATAVPAFRRLHLAAILVNLAQLVLIVWALIAVSIDAAAAT